jgi:hypothetical protein
VELSEKTASQEPLRNQLINQEPTRIRENENWWKLISESQPENKQTENRFLVGSNRFFW